MENKEKKSPAMSYNSDAKVSLKDIIRELNLDVVYMEPGMDEKTYIHTPEINRPGLQLAGYFEYFAYDRVQIIGKTEYTYFSKKSDEEREEILDTFFSYDFPVLIFSHGAKITEQYIKYAKKYNRIILSTNRLTTRLINKLSNYLDTKMAKTITVHGVLVDIFGVGVLIKGDSGIGKSETALELVQRGHRLVADDSVEIMLEDENRLSGTAPEMLRHYLEIRGIGIVDIRGLYGARAVKLRHPIDMVVYIEEWKEDHYYDRIGLDKEYEKVIGVEIEKITVPVKPGRNTAMILEVAAMNFRQKLMGYNAAEEFTRKLERTIKENSL